MLTSADCVPIGAHYRFIRLQLSTSEAQTTIQNVHQLFLFVHRKKKRWDREKCRTALRNTTITCIRTNAHGDTSDLISQLPEDFIRRRRIGTIMCVSVYAFTICNLSTQFISIIHILFVFSIAELSPISTMYCHIWWPPLFRCRWARCIFIYTPNSLQFQLLSCAMRV